MLYNAVNGSLKTHGMTMDYICFGKGESDLVIIPGLGDGLKTVKGSAIPLAMMYRCFAHKYRVYVLSRKNELEEGCTTKDMAADCKTAMQALGILQADVLGVSQGGMIAQYIAIDYPGMVKKLVLAVTLARQNQTVQTTVGGWIKLARAGDYKGIFIDAAEKSYTEKRLKKFRPLYPLLSKIGRPKDFGRFIIQANACIGHNAYDELAQIKCPVLVIGVGDDKVVGANSSQEIAERIEGSELVIYEGHGHAVYEEAKDFNPRVVEFLST